MKYLIVTGTVTYALRARDTLKRNGISAVVERVRGNPSSDGCGYGVIASGDIDTIKHLIMSSGVKIKRIEELFG